MKKLKIRLTVVTFALLFLITDNVIASSITSLEIVPTDQSKMILLSLTAKGQGLIKLQIIDAQQEIIFSEKVNSQKSLEKKFNLKHLSEGAYSLVVEDENNIRTQPLLVKDGQVKVDVSLRTIKHKPNLVMNQEKAYFDINWLMNEISTYELIIESSDPNFLYEDKIKDNYTIHKRYNIKNLRKGVYYLTIKNENRVYYKTITVE